MLSTEVLNLSKKSVLCWLATVGKDGQPNVSPKEIWEIIDETHLAIANIASPISEQNIIDHSLVCVSFIDIFTQKGFKINGNAINIKTTNLDYTKWAANLEIAATEKFRINSIILIEATKVSPILAPSYIFYPDQTTEDSQIRSALRTYDIQSMSSKYD